VIFRATEPSRQRQPVSCAGTKIKTPQQKGTQSPRALPPCAHRTPAMCNMPCSHVPGVWCAHGGLASLRLVLVFGVILWPGRREESPTSSQKHSTQRPITSFVSCTRSPRPHKASRAQHPQRGRSQPAYNSVNETFLGIVQVNSSQFCLHALALAPCETQDCNRHVRMLEIEICTSHPHFWFFL